MNYITAKQIIEAERAGRIIAIYPRKHIVCLDGFKYYKVSGGVIDRYKYFKKTGWLTFSD